ncbi:hypothetical protein ACNKHM_11215 [Shigella sonnei]
MENLPEFANLPVEELITKLDQLPADKKTVLRKNVVVTLTTVCSGKV